MPVGRARRLCPQAVFIPPRHRLYGEVSKEVMAIFRAVTPEVEPLSLDEAFLDVSGAKRRLGPPRAIAELIRRQVREQQSITCSVGVAPVKFVAKIASARCKPDGLLVVPADGLLDFLHPLPVSALWGVGDRAEEVLTRLGLRTVGDIAHVPAATLQAGARRARASTCTPSPGAGTSDRLSRGGRRRASAPRRRSPTDVDDPEVIRKELLRLSGRTAQALRAAGCVARTVTVKLRLASFKTITRSRTLPEPTDVAREIYTTACALYEGSGLDGRARLRLVGVRATGLRPAAGAARQLAFGDRPAGWREAEQAVDRIARRFGTDAVRPAALFGTSQEPAQPASPEESRPEVPFQPA